MPNTIKMPWDKVLHCTVHGKTTYSFSVHLKLSFLKAFNLWLVEFMDVEPVGMEVQLGIWFLNSFVGFLWNAERWRGTEILYLWRDSLSALCLHPGQAEARRRKEPNPGSHRGGGDPVTCIMKKLGSGAELELAPRYSNGGHRRPKWLCHCATKCLSLCMCLTFFTRWQVCRRQGKRLISTSYPQSFAYCNSTHGDQIHSRSFFFFFLSVNRGKGQ